MSRIGYAELSDSITISGNIGLKYKMEEIAKELDEVTVTGDRSKIVKRTANGEIFYLSEAAKKEKDPFVALQEIPVLISDPATTSVKLMNGKSPKILIDGNVVNTGINPISPADIESVEVIRNVSARFLQMGVDAIVNIKLKRSARVYQWYQVATRHDIPLDYGLGVGYFEVGNQKLSLYGRVAYDYTYHDDEESTIDRSNTTYSQNYDQTNRKDGHSWLGDLMLKSSFTPKDYFAAYVYGKTTTTKRNQSALGTYETTTEVPYSLNGRSHDKNDVFTSSLYYKHSFAANNNLEFRLAYNYNRNDYNANQTDTYGESSAL